MDYVGGNSLRALDGSGTVVANTTIPYMDRISTDVDRRRRACDHCSRTIGTAASPKSRNHQLASHHSHTNIRTRVESYTHIQAMYRATDQSIVRARWKSSIDTRLIARIHTARTNCALRTPACTVGTGNHSRRYTLACICCRYSRTSCSRATRT